ncbi:MAG TPA: flavin reductase family protein [Actinocrinis sp.]|nr:flavin reductase family protein [Actinocrinis sp.]
MNVTAVDAHRVITPSILYFGTPVTVVSSENADGSANLAPISSAWALGDVFVLGFGADGHTAGNLRARPQLVLNFPAPGQWAQVERLALLTGADPVPADKPAGCRYEPDKFGAAGWHPVPSELVRPPRVAECPVQIEATVSGLRLDAAGEFVIVEAKAVRVHADPAIVVDGTSHVDTAAWSPLIYNFRHYFGLGPRLGKARRAEY